MDNFLHKKVHIYKMGPNQALIDGNLSEGVVGRIELWAFSRVIDS